MAENLDIFYWDACIFFEHLNEEQVDQRKRQAIDDLLSETKNREIEFALL